MLEKKLQPRQEIRLFGLFRTVVDDIPITDLSAPRAQSLLAYLILHADIPQPRQHLAYVLWPDSTEHQARTNLRKTIHQLRNSLPEADACLWMTRTTIQWNPFAPYFVDVLEMNWLLNEIADRNRTGKTPDTDLLLRLANLYDGDLLPNCYDDWIAPIRADYHRRVCSAIGVLVEQLENSRSYEQAIEYAHRLLELNPLDETTCQQVMRLHVLNGDRSAAVTVFQQFSEVLQSELDVEPNEETVALYERMLKDEPPDSSSDPRANVHSGADRLVARELEWQILREAWQHAAQGNAHLVAITGEAGLGKTRLAEELLQWARQQGLRAERTRSYAAHGALAYTPIAELLQTETLRAQLPNLDPVWLPELARLLPELLTKHPDVSPPQPMVESWQRQRFFDALSRAILADKDPLLLLFDDLQWCDQETLEWLNYVLHHAPDARLLIVGTVRIDEIDDDHPYTKLEMALAHSSQLATIPLAPLNEDDTQALAVQIADYQLSDNKARQIYQDTEGNPLFVVETIREQSPKDAGGALATKILPEPDVAIARLPAKVHMVIRSRLSRLSPRAHELANLAAVVGRSFSYEVLQIATQQDTSTLADGLDELLHRRIIVERDTASFDFSHDRIRDVAYAEISLVRRRLLHDRVAQAILQVFASNLDSYSGDLATHFAQAGRKQEAIDYLIRAGERSANQYANEEAIGYFTRALELLPTDRLLERYDLQMCRLKVLERIQDVSRRSKELDELKYVVEQLDEGDQQGLYRRAELAVHRAHYDYQTGAPLDAIRIATQAMQWAEELQSAQIDYDARLVLSFAHWSQGDMQQVRDLLEAPLVKAQQEGLDEIAAGLMSRLAATGMFSGMKATDIQNYLEQFLSNYQRAGNIEGMSDAYNKLGYINVHGFAERYEEALQYYARGLELAERAGNVNDQANIESNIGYLHVLRGDYATSQTYLDRALARSRFADFTMREAVTLIYIGYAQRNRGDYDAALASQEEALEVLSKMRLPLWRTWSRRELALIYRAKGRLDLAEEQAREAIEIAHKLGDIRQKGYALTALGLALEDQGSFEAVGYFRQAIDCYEEMELLSRSMAPLAGLARIAHWNSEISGTHVYIEEIVNYLANRELDRTEEGFRVYVTCYSHLHANGDPRATEILSMAQEHLRIRASSITDLAQQRLFWDMPYHRRIRDETQSARKRILSR